MKKEMIMQIGANDPVSGKWYFADVHLPAKQYELEDALQRARVTNDDVYREYRIYECELLPMLDGYRLDSPTMDELNFFARRLASLGEDERLVLQAVAPKYIPDDEDTLISAKDLINLTYGLDEVMVISNVGNTKSLGQFVIDNGMNDLITDTPKESLPYLDRYKIGQMQQETDGGVFLDGKYIVAGSYELKEIYDGMELLPIENEMENCAFRLELMNAPEVDDGIGTDLPTRWLSLPTDEATAQALAEELGAECIEDCVYIGFESTVPQIESEHFGDMHDFNKLNSLSQMLMEMTPSDQVKFKAVLSAEEPTEIEEILDVARNMHQYKLASQVEDASQFFKSYILRHMDTRFDPKWLNSPVLRNEGDRLLKRLGATVTDYGIISKRCGGLYELVAYNEPKDNPLFAEKFELIEINEQTALFTNGRITASDVPDGLFKYDLRSGDATDFATIETNVTVNHAASILVKHPFDFAGLEYIPLSDETSPDFLGDTVTVGEFTATDYDREISEEQTMKMGGM